MRNNKDHMHYTATRTLMIKSPSSIHQLNVNISKTRQNTNSPYPSAFLPLSKIIVYTSAWVIDREQSIN